MAADINKVVLVGRLTRDCEVKPLTNTSVCNFSVAVNRRANQNGAWVDEANFFDVELFGALGPALQSYLIKGKQVAVEGTLRQHRWETPEGKRSRITIHADNVQLLGGNSPSGTPSGNYNTHQPQNNKNSSEHNSDFQGSSGSSQTSQTNGNVDNSSSNMVDFQDDIPF